MGDWDTGPDIQRWAEAAAPASSGAALAIPAVGTANLKGAWQVSQAATTLSTGMLYIWAQGGTTSPSDGSIDIGIGGSGSEQIIVPDLLVSRGASGDVPFSFYSFPLQLPGLQRLVARGAFTVTTATGRVQLAYGDLWNFSGNSEPGSAVQALGNGGAAVGRGTQVDPGTSANTKGVWSQLSASTARSMWYCYLGIGNAGQTHTNGGSWALDIGIGASGSEQVIGPPDILVACPAGARIPTPAAIGPLPLFIPAGSRVCVRASSSITTADRIFDACLYGVVA